MTVLPLPSHEPTWISRVGATTTVLRALATFRSALASWPPEK